MTITTDIRIFVEPQTKYLNMLISEIQKRKDIEKIYTEIRKHYPFESTSINQLRAIHEACIKAYEENPLNFLEENLKIALSYLKKTALR